MRLKEIGYIDDKYSRYCVFKTHLLVLCRNLCCLFH